MAPFYYAPYDVLNVTLDSWLVLLPSHPTGVGGGRSAAHAVLAAARAMSVWCLMLLSMWLDLSYSVSLSLVGDGCIHSPQQSP